MKKILAIVLCVCAVGVVMGQRPVRQVSVGNNNSQVTLQRGERICGSAVKTYSYTISEMSIANVTVMDNVATVKQEGRTDKVKVTVNGVSGISYYLYDANDQAVSKNYINGGVGYIDMSSYQCGEYRLQLIEPKGAERNFRIVKKQK